MSIFNVIHMLIVLTWLVLSIYFKSENFAISLQLTKIRWLHDK